MYDNWGVNAVVALATLVSIAASVLLHYEGLILTARRLGHMGGHRRIKVLYAIGSVLLLHVLEIWIFAAAFWLLMHLPGSGSIGNGPQHLFDLVYFSAMTYTTVGYGDLAPLGPIRFVAGTEALTGFVLIAWSASFTYLEMERYWRSP